MRTEPAPHRISTPFPAGRCPQCERNLLPVTGQRYCQNCGFALPDPRARPRSSPVGRALARLHSARSVLAQRVPRLPDRATALLVLSASLLLPLPASLALVGVLGYRYRDPWWFFAVMAAAAAVLLLGHRRQIWRLLSGIDWSGRWRPHWAWSLVLAALVLRFLLLDYLPLPLPILEENQAGGIGARQVDGGGLTLQFRFTNWMVAGGFHLFGYSLEGMRSLFSVAGVLSVLLMALTLRRLSAGWPATLFGVFVMASLRVLVVGGNTAEETFGALVLETALLYCAVSAFRAGSCRLLWAGLAGMAAGALMYEYVPYKFLVVAPALVYLWQLLRGGDSVTGDSGAGDSGAGNFGTGDAGSPDAGVPDVGVPGDRTGPALALLSYVMCLSVVAAPILADFAGRPGQSALLEILVRHSGDRGVSFTDPEQVRASLFKMWDFIRSLLGQSAVSEVMPRGMPLTERDGAMVPALLGALFAVGFARALWRPRLEFLRTSAILALLNVAVYGVVAHNFNPGVLVPMLPLLILLAAVALDDADRRLSALLRRPIVALLPVLLMVAVTALNVQAVARLAEDPILRRYLSSSRYDVCRIVADAPYQYRSIVLSPRGVHCAYDNDDQWLHPRHRDTPITKLDDLPAAEDIAPGTLVVHGRQAGLDREQVSAAARLAASTDSAHTWTLTENLSGKVTAVSFCYRCQPAERRPDTGRWLPGRR